MFLLKDINCYQKENNPLLPLMLKLKKPKYRKFDGSCFSFMSSEVSGEERLQCVVYKLLPLQGMLPTQLKLPLTDYCN